HADCDLCNYSRDLRPAEWGPTVILRGNNSESRMSALCQKRTMKSGGSQRISPSCRSHYAERDLAGKCRLQRGSLRMLRALIWPLAVAAMDDAGGAAFRAWPHVKSVSDVAATAIVTDSVDGCERITMKVLRPSEQRRAARI